MFRPIGIFDSGVGGVSVLRDAMALLPQVVDLADVESVTVGDCVIPVEL